MLMKSMILSVAIALVTLFSPILAKSSTPFEWDNRAYLSGDFKQELAEIIGFDAILYAMELRSGGFGLKDKNARLNVWAKGPNEDSLTNFTIILRTPLALESAKSMVYDKKAKSRAGRPLKKIDFSFIAVKIEDVIDARQAMPMPAEVEKFRGKDKNFPFGGVNSYKIIFGNYPGGMCHEMSVFVLNYIQENNRDRATYYPWDFIYKDVIYYSDDKGEMALPQTIIHGSNSIIPAERMPYVKRRVDKQ